MSVVPMVRGVAHRYGRHCCEGINTLLMSNADAFTTLADRPLALPSEQRLAPDHPAYVEIIAAHQAALTRGDGGYIDPVTGLFVMSAALHAQRGFCCGRGCRHCPYCD